MTPDLWIQSLRADPSRTARYNDVGSNNRPALKVGRRKSERVDNTNANVDKQDTGRRGLHPESPRNKRTETTIDPPDKCSNICCNYLSRSLAQWESHSKTMSKLRMNDYVEPNRILEQISRAEALRTSYETEISRLKRILAACPPPGQKISSRECKRTLSFCKHACCNPSLRPTRASTEMLRLRRIIQHLQIRGREILEYLNLKRCLLSPIRRLPPELLQMVFSFAVIPDRRDPWSVTITQSSVGAVRLAHVCSYWRTIALDARRLFATILIPREPSRHQSSIAHLEFYSSYAKASPLTIHCHKRPARRLLKKIARMSHRWYDISLTVQNDAFEELNVVRHKIPLLTSLCIYNESERDGAQTNDAFERAPALRRVVFSVGHDHIWPFSFILPWEQLTSLTLVPISLSVFSECIRNCRQLLYFHAVILPRPGEVVQQMAELRSPVRKLVLMGSGCQEVLVAHSFPNLLSLSIVLSGQLHPDFLAFLARSTRLEMLSVRSWGSATTADVLALLLAMPSLRMLHFRDWRTVMVTSRFSAPLVAPALDDPFDAVEPQSLAELGVEGCAAFNEVELLALIQRRRERSPFFDPYGIERARLQIENVPFDSEAELGYLAYRS
ncbi:F-box domain-containing protein [Mycena venus]|uniref:F-box domain-containing protein n=1 Tax=Mycena venus TaxID=2733690 RepID=A0A8H6XIB8_9AGAR|nr:F-box domain-containing protein [Mycena venus]